MQRILLVITPVIALAIAACGGDDDAARTFRVASCHPEPPLAEVRVASLNVLHGIFCPAATVDCRIADRVDLLFEWIESIGCPEVVVLQEVLGPRVADALRDQVGRRCAFTYEIHEPPRGSQNFTLSRYPVLATNENTLFGGLRVLWHTRIDHPIGVVDVFNTHLAAGVDGGPSACGESCPEECRERGAVSTRDCQAVQVANRASQHAAAGSLRVLAGDFNATPDTFVYRHLLERGWFDVFTEAGNFECDPTTGNGCTSGREDEALEDMESPANGVRRRIDYLFIQAAPGQAAPDDGSGCRCTIDSSADRDGDGVATKIFADDANPFADTCGAAPQPICWPSDHEGMQLDLNCR